jgi:hypothetical protein
LRVPPSSAWTISRCGNLSAERRCWRRRYHLCDRSGLREHRHVAGRAGRGLGRNLDREFAEQAADSVRQSAGPTQANADQ